MRVNGDSKMAIGVNGKLSRVDPSYGYKLKLVGWMNGWLEGIVLWALW